MAYLDWHVGMKVVCVSSNKVGREYKGKRTQWPECVQKGGVYTIRDIDTSLAHLGCAVAIRLDEYHHPKDLCGWETPFPASHFRPVQTRKTDISVFTAMLHDQRQKVPA